MCGRYALYTPREHLRHLLGIERDLTAREPWRGRYNIAPGQLVAAVRAAPRDGARELVMLQWGLVPCWAKDAKTGYRLINARAETVASKPAFRSAYRQRRCLLPADGFYEWQLTATRGKQPYFITLTEGAPFAIAGLWERWQGNDGQCLDSCTLLVTGANALVQPIHDRMPVILEPAEYAAWLDPANRDPAALERLLRPYPPARMTAIPVSPRVNRPQNEDPACIEPAAIR